MLSFLLMKLTLALAPLTRRSMVAGFASLAAPAMATQSVGNGERLFSANCAVCHAGGGNVVLQSKTLDSVDLAANGYGRSEIETIISRGRGAMPGFGEEPGHESRARLDAEEVSDITDYVIEQAQAGWPITDVPLR